MSLLISQAAILCGGLGTRLGSLTANLPKPLVDVAGRPFLELLLFELARQGVRDVVLLAGFHAQQIVDFAATTSVRSRFELKIEVSIEPQLAGTGGAVWHARKLLDDRFYLLNGDTWFDINILSLAAQLSDSPSAIGALSLRSLEDASRYGVVRLSADQITAYAARPESAGPGLVSGGVYVMRDTLIDELSPECSLEGDIFPRLVANRRLLGKPFDGYFIDIGLPADLARARGEISVRRCRPAVCLGVELLRSTTTHGIDRAAIIAAVRALNDAGFLVFLRDAEKSEPDAALVGEFAAAGAHFDNVGRAFDDIASDWPLDRRRMFMVTDDPATSLPVQRISFADLPALMRSVAP